VDGTVTRPISNLMLTRGAERPAEVRPSTTTLYLFAADVVSTHATLVANGIRPGAIVYPDYMPCGEFGVRDPDGYQLTIAQAGRIHLN